eukprot:759683-Hanusia_phi.AAC.8
MGPCDNEKKGVWWVIREGVGVLDAQVRVLEISECTPLRSSAKHPRASRPSPTNGTLQRRQAE